MTGRIALLALTAALAVVQVAPAQERVALQAARDLARDAWTSADAALREARRLAAAARAEHQIHLRHERDLLGAPWWLPRVLVAGRLEGVRRAAHAAAAAVVEAEHRVSGAEAQERITRRQFLIAADEWVTHLMSHEGDAATIQAELDTIGHLGAREDLAPRPTTARLDTATLARLSAVELEGLELGFEELARDADGRRAALERLRDRAARRVANLERRVLRQAAAGLAERLARERADHDQLAAWVGVEADRATSYRRTVRELEAARERVERRERAARGGGDQGQ